MIITKSHVYSAYQLLTRSPNGCFVVIKLYFNDVKIREQNITKLAVVMLIDGGKAILIMTNYNFILYLFMKHSTGISSLYICIARFQ